jgi:hypothetical protein
VALVVASDNTGLRAFLAALTLGAVALTGVAVNVLLDARGKQLPLLLSKWRLRLCIRCTNQKRGKERTATTSR